MRAWNALNAATAGTAIASRYAVVTSASAMLAMTAADADARA